MSAIVGLLLVPFEIMLNGWFISTLWRWLMVPAFNVQALSVPVCIAICMMVSAIHPTINPWSKTIEKIEGEWAKIVAGAFVSLARVGLGLLMALVVREFI